MVLSIGETVEETGGEGGTDVGGVDEGIGRSVEEGEGGEIGVQKPRSAMVLSLEVWMMSSRNAVDYMWPTCGLHVAYTWTTCGLHVDYMWPTCGLHR